jgi:hypothetical protein
MKKIMLLLVLVIPFRCLAADPEISETIAYDGKIGGQNVFMTLSITNDSVFGSYFYKKYRSPIPLGGSVFGSKLMLTEVADNGGARIEAELKKDGIEGIWSLNEESHITKYKALSKSYLTIIDKIDVLRGDDENKILAITFVDGASQKIDLPLIEERTLIIFEDFTFDGYPDMRILELEAGGNSSFIYFDYNSAINKFESSSKEIGRLVDPKIFHDEKVIISVSRDGCCIYHAIKILPKEIRLANYDFESKVGSEITKDKSAQGESKRAISEKYFEENYLKFKYVSGKNL